MYKSVIFTNASYIGNAGDFWASPLHYYSFPFRVEHLHYMDIVRDIEKGKLEKYKNRKIVIGGGGMLNQDGNRLNKTLKFLIKNNLVILWGMGSNSLGEYSWNIMDHPNIVLKGIRDYVKEIDEAYYLPCVSCKHELFKRITDNEPKEDLGLLEHSYYRINLPEIPSIVHDKSISEFLDFISKHKRLVSSTYHGIYWSQLLKKEVAYYSGSHLINSKITNLKYPIHVVTNKNLKNWNSDSSKYDTYLDECIELNDKFYERVLELF